MLTISQGEGHTRAWAEISEKIDKSESPQDLMLIYRDNLYRSKRSVKARIQQLGLDEIDFDFEVDWTWPI